MKRMTRYIVGSAIAGSLIALLVIVALELVFAFVEETGDLGRGDYNALTAMLYVLLTAPYRAYEAFPMATLIGSLMGLGTLAARNELTAMRAAGFSVLAVAGAVMLAGVVLGATAFAIGEYLAPPAEHYAQNLRAMAMTQQVALDRQRGFWARDGSRFVQVDRALSDRSLQGLRIYEFDSERELEQVLQAESARFGAGGWQLQGVRATRFSGEGVEIEELADLVWDADLEPQMLEVVVVDPETLPIAALTEYIAYLERNGLETSRYRLAFWVKIATPVATIALLLLTVPLVFGSVRSAGAGQRIFLGVLIGIVFLLFNRLLNHAGLVYGLPPALSALLPSMLFGLIGLWGVARVR